MYKDARKQAGLSIEEASFRVHIGQRTLCKYEAGETTPPPDVVLKMSEVYKMPQLTAWYCREECAIGQRYCYELLNNVDLSPVAILTKFMDEKSEIDQLLGRLMAVVLNKKSAADFTEQEMEDFKLAVLELLDLEHVIETLKLQIWKFINVAELVKEHNEKCLRQGYVKKEKAPLAKAL